MPTYRYQVKSSGGQITVGVLSAENAMTAAAILRNQGNHVLSLTPVVGGIAQSQLFERIKQLNAGKPKLKHVLDFTTQLAVMVRAGSR